MANGSRVGEQNTPLSQIQEELFRSSMSVTSFVQALENLTLLHFPHFSGSVKFRSQLNYLYLFAYSANRHSFGSLCLVKNQIAI